MAQSAVGAIRAGCQMLAEGKQFIDDAKSEVEGIVGQVKDTYDTVAGLWDWVKGLLGTSNKPARSVSAKQIQIAETAKPAKKDRREPEQELSFEEFQARAVHDICENLKVYFEAMRHLKAHCRELEELALTTDKVADSAIDRIEIQWQMNQLSAQLKQAMIYGTPESLGLGSMYKEFLVKYDEILEEQEVARELKAKRDRDNRWRLEHRKEILIGKVTYAVAVAMGFLQLIGMYFTL
jgi:hypothetical protein